MIENDMTSAREKSKNIDTYNENRRELDKKITDEAITYIESHIEMIQQKSIVIYNETWHKGIVGIVASRLTEKYYRPAVVLTKSGEMISGSARSVPGFDVYKAIESCRDILENFGGHTYAAGLTLREENLKEFTERFNMLSFDGVEARMMLPQITVDAEISLSQITPTLIDELDLFNPFGPENENPIFLTKEVYDAGNSRLVGKENRHIKLEIVDKTVERPFPGIAFSQHDFYQRIKSGLPVDICYTIEENRHGSNLFTQLIIRDIKE